MRTVRSLIASGEQPQKLVSDLSGIDSGQLTRFLKRDDDRGLSVEQLEALRNALSGHKHPAYGQPLPPGHARALAQKLHDGQLALFAGAGLSHLAPRHDGKPLRLPLWSGLAERVAFACGHADTASDFPDPLDLFDHIILDSEGSGRDRLNEVIASALDDKPYAPSAAHQVLKRLPWSSVLTTNYDSLLAQTLSEVPVASEAEYVRLASTSKPRLFQLHGSLSNPHTLTREDYRLWAEKHPQAMTHLLGLLQQQTVLFVGYSLSDRHFDEVMSLIRDWTKASEKVTYAWMWHPTAAQTQLMERRDRIQAVPIQSEDQYEAAFAQVLQELERLRAGKPN
jgi:hypothetical protein